MRTAGLRQIKSVPQWAVQYPGVGVALNVVLYKSEGAYLRTVESPAIAGEL